MELPQQNAAEKAAAAAPPSASDIGIDAGELSQQDAFDIVEGKLRTALAPDTAAFLRLLEGLDWDEAVAAASEPPAARGLTAAERAAVRGLFDWQGGDEVVVARAPGRLDVMGGIADYSGSLVLQLPLAQACHVAVQQRPPPPDGEPTLRIVSLGGGCDRAPACELPLAELWPGGRPLALDAARALFAEDPAKTWAAYVAGTLLVLGRECGADPGGASLAVLVASDVPAGSGVSSSAALEVAAMTAFAAALRVEVPPTRLALLCQTVENRVVGAPCGVMDQMAAALGLSGSLMALTCRPAQLASPVAVPQHLRLWGVDSGTRHSVGGADYGTVRAIVWHGAHRAAAFMGLALMSARDAELQRQKAGAAGQPDTAPQQQEAALIGSGYLCAVNPSTFQQMHEAALPEVLSGAAFLAEHPRHLDPVTSVNPNHRYPVRQATAHPIHENFRVEAFRALLEASPTAAPPLLLLGELMLQSHASYSRCGLGSTGTDLLVDLVRQEIAEAGARGEEPALFGAKITGGGSGGTVCILGRAGDAGQAAMERLVAAYHEKTGHKPQVFNGSSSGSAAYGHLRIRRRHPAS